jgi:signal transduction histidine kinase/CheY-like chemotaxis protein/ABC-type sugar transport system substrate-binding protein
MRSVDDPRADKPRWQRPTLGVLYGWQVYQSDMDLYLESLIGCLTAAAQRAEVNLVTAVAVGKTARNACPAWPFIGTNRIFAPVGPWNTDGLIVINPLPAPETVDDVRRLQQSGHPVVYLSNGPYGPVIVPDNHGGIEQAVTHLAAHGHRRIAFLSCETGDGPERRAAYEATVRKLELEVDSALVVDALHERHAAGGAIDRLVEHGVEFTAVVSSNGHSGRGALIRLRELGLVVPDDVALVAYDDFLEALTTDPALTSIHFPVDEAAQAAVDALLAQIEHGIEPPPLQTVPTHLIERESCGCKPTYAGEISERERRTVAKKVVDRGEVSNAVSTFASRLLAAPQLDMAELGRILGDSLTQVGIANPLLGVYEPAGDDPVAWTVIQPGDGLPSIRFHTRDFPPSELSLPEPYRMIVIPLRLHEEFGFVALPSDDIGSCVAIAFQSEAAFESARNVKVREAAEAALAETEEQLRQAQKMEAIGQLAGGIAHDFNNLLTPIVGCSSLILARAGDDPKLRETIELIASAADRAASLTQQLLAFSRRQIMQPVVLDLNEVLENTHALLDEVLGHNLELVLRLGHDAGCVKADRSQLEQVVLNLAVNARDAMSDGGTLTLETDKICLDEVEAHALTLTPGHYTSLTASDTGTGMTDDVRARAFEPFFTTKKNGGSTGLGLATVYGIVKQSGGAVHVASSPDGGCTFTVYLPSVEAERRSPELVSRWPTEHAAGTSARTVLVVDDEEIVRRFIRQALELDSYRVLEASNGREALDLCLRHRDEIDLLITDIVMPIMNGKELVERLAQERVQLSVVCMSGYAESSIFEDHVLSAAVAYLPKPFSGSELQEKISSVLPAAT